MKKLTKKQAQEKLYSMWENGELPSNFTEEHSEYSIAINQLMEYGYLIFDELSI